MPTTAHKSRRLVTLDAAAEYAACSTKTLRRRISDGSLTGYRLGPRMLRIDLDELDAMLRPVPSAVRRSGALR
ncbi:helix-turn-helix domain-containing protein [Ornithinimicrobium sp. Y1694]|uniref:helix-turn-helix domain-containing protein n=1 Tax=Ornithinimicrobium sp. Y1694 TaxID=3418590 RepID=UPI003CF48E60